VTTSDTVVLMIVVMVVVEVEIELDSVEVTSVVVTSSTNGAVDVSTVVLF